MDGFAHLHVASGFSMRYGASLPEDLVERAAAHGQGALALTDRDGLYDAVRFATACGRAGVAPVLGVDLAVEALPLGAVGSAAGSGDAVPRRPRTPVLRPRGLRRTTAPSPRAAAPSRVRRRSSSTPSERRGTSRSSRSSPGPWSKRATRSTG